MSIAWGWVGGRRAGCGVGWEGWEVDKLHAIVHL